jgi:hypothetical protein
MAYERPTYLNPSLTMTSGSRRTKIYLKKEKGTNIMVSVGYSL